MDSISSSSSPSSSSGSLDANDFEAGFSGCTPCVTHSPLPPPHAQDWRRRESYKGVLVSPRARFFVEEDYDEPRHFLDSCFLCKKPLAGNLDIFMYRGDTPFCSVECREEQIEMDEAREKKLNLSLKNSSMKEQQNASKTSATTSSSKSQKIHVRAGTVVAS